MIDQILLDLREARTYLADKGWVQGHMVPDVGAVWDGQPACGWGALYIVVYPGISGTFRIPKDVTRRVSHARSWLTHVANGDSLIEFNDRHHTTRADVLDLYDRAIAAREQLLEREL